MIGPTLTAWRAERRGKSLDIGRPPEHDLRRIMDAILYVDRTGIPWRYLPHDFAPWETVYGYFAAWQKEGVFNHLNGLLRRLARQAEGRDGEPTACVLDAQSVKTSSNVPAAGQGIDAGKKTAGRKRHIEVDTLGLLLRLRLRRGPGRGESAPGRRRPAAPEARRGHRRQSVFVTGDPPDAAAPGHPSRHPRTGGPEGQPDAARPDRRQTTGLRPRPLQGPQRRRTLLQPPQAVPRDRTRFDKLADRYKAASASTHSSSGSGNLPKII
ncbi:transposase [Streptomyces collinus]|uniref:transposase n=1 Tax=Streptomyces collinus TaxID=42684 RepID=UPI0036CEA870